MHFIKEIKFIKNDGTIEDYDENRMIRFLERIGIKEPLALLGDFCEEVNGTMRTSDVIKTLERVAARKITPANPHWEEDAAKLYFAAALNRDYDGKYPGLGILKQCDKIDQVLLKQWEPHLAELEDYIKPQRDNLFVYKSAALFHGKYCHDIGLTGKKEMPQIAYMRVAMFLTTNEMRNGSIQPTKDLYDALSLHQFTMATPTMVNALTTRSQTSSCVLLEVGDSTESLLDVNAKIGTMSAWLAGTACNVQNLRARGSRIANGRTSGPVPFIKVFESTVSAWNQGGTRPGALAIYFQWWHPDVMDMLSLKSNGGTEENRARRLKYALKLNDYFIRAVMNDETVALVSPHEAPDLYGVYGEEFEKRYAKYLKDPKTTKIRAREIWAKLFKERSETGNIYLFHEENVNEVSMINRYIGSSNLCTEVVLPTAAPKNFESRVQMLGITEDSHNGNS